MSSETLYWLKLNGGVWKPHLPTNRQVGHHFQALVVENLGLHADQFGEVYVSDRKQEIEMNADRRDIRNARDLLAAQGWLVDTGKTRQRAKVWRLSIPGYEWTTENAPVNGRANGRANGRGVGRDNPPLTEQNRNTPLTPQTGQAPRREKETGGGSFISDCVEACVAWEQDNYPKQAGMGLLKTWRQEYAQIVKLEALNEHGLTDRDSVVSWATSKRHGKDTAPRTATPTVADTYQGQQDCPHCHGQGYGLVRDTQGVATTKKCVCRGGTWAGEEPPPAQLRVVV